MQVGTDHDKQLQNAMKATVRMSEMMDRYVAMSFNRTTSASLAVASVVALLLGMFVIPIAAVAASVTGIAATATLVGAGCCLGAGTIGFGYCIITSYPSHNFSAASRALNRAANNLPEGAKKLFQKFNKRANTLFALAYAASAQERLIDGMEDGRALDDLEHEVEASLRKHLDGLEACLRVDFRERKLPEAEAFRQEFSALSARLRKSVKASIGTTGVGVKSET